ncbi:hypothetical protein [Clostridium chrysemydis]|uniref:hypothetical protein n=1 Tax=Clostridium chrysemydis TaxID=2665504 RepID=UPI0018838268|nr:hypothetical protein [Clostridium chrysemydis]
MDKLSCYNKTIEENLKLTKEKVLKLLKKDEKIEVCIKGFSEKALKTLPLISLLSEESLLKFNKSAFNYLIFITNERIFINEHLSDSKSPELKIYDKSLIESFRGKPKNLHKKISYFNHYKEHKRLAVITRICKSILFLAGILPIIIIFTLLFDYLLEFGFNDYRGIIFSVLFTVLIGIFFMRKLEKKMEVEIIFKDKTKIEFLILNLSCINNVKRYLKKIKAKKEK